MNYLQGQELKVIFDEDPQYYYRGRFQIDQWDSDKRTSQITIKGVVDPYKYELYSSVDDYYWDSFNFEVGVARDYRDIEVNGNLDFEIIGSRMSDVPVFQVSNANNLKVIHDGETYDLTNGENRFITIVVRDGITNVKFTGKGTVSIEYQGGSL